jgi:hypothetical protein
LNEVLVLEGWWNEKLFIKFKLAAPLLARVVNIVLDKKVENRVQHILQKVEVIMGHFGRRHQTCQVRSARFFELVSVFHGDQGVLLSVKDKCGACHFGNAADVVKHVGNDI